MRFIFILINLLLLGCSNEQPNNQQALITQLQTQSPTSNLAVPNNRASTAYRIAIVGNSHVFNLTNTINEIVSQLTPNKTVYSEVIGQGFLDETIKNSNTVARLKQGEWTHIILQGQKYSQSRSRTYPTIGAQKWIAEAKEHGITPILFPEHPQRGDSTEAQYVHGLHQAILQQQTSCLAPVGLAWDQMISLAPSLALHASDGNHASDIGKYLSALVFAEVITGQKVDAITLETINNLAPDLQLLMAQTVSQTIYSHPACPF